MDDAGRGQTLRAVAEGAELIFASCGCDGTVIAVVTALDAPNNCQRPPQYRETLVNPFRDHLRRRCIEEPGVAVTPLLAEIREYGYTGSSNLLVRYLNQGRADAERAAPSPRRRVSRSMSHPTSCLPTASRRPAPLQGFVHGLRMDLPAVTAGLTLPYSNWLIEGANTEV